MSWKSALVSLPDLKVSLHRSDLGRLDKLLLVLSSFDAPCQIRNIRERAEEAGFRALKNWNPSDLLGRSKGLAIRTPAGWEITDAGRRRLREIGIAETGPAAQAATGLRAHLPKIGDSAIHSFAEEAIGCYEAKFYRSAIVMSWIAAMAVLHDRVCAKHLAEFNKEAKRVDAKWKDAIAPDDLGRMREADFLDLIERLSIIGKDVKKQLKSCLDLRNGCGHPNSLRIGASTAERHLELLLLNVFEKFR